MNVVYRLANTSEAEEIAILLVQAFEPWPQGYALRLVEFWFQHQPDLFFVAEVESRLVAAMAGLVKPWSDGNRLVETILFVHHDYRKNHIGKTLFVKMLKEGINKYNIVTFEGITYDSDFPLRWYESIEFTKQTDLCFVSGNAQEMLDLLRT